MKIIKVIGAIKVFILFSILVSHVLAYDLNQSTSKYDQNVSKYDIGFQTIRFQFDVELGKCVETSLKEREAILADIKSGRFKIKSHPDSKGVVILSDDFSTGKEFEYYNDVKVCLKIHKDEIIDRLRLERYNDRRYVPNGYNGY